MRPLRVNHSISILLILIQRGRRILPTPQTICLQCVYVNDYLSMQTVVVLESWRLVNGGIDQMGNQSSHLGLGPDADNALVIYHNVVIVASRLVQGG